MIEDNISMNATLDDDSLDVDYFYAIFLPLLCFITSLGNLVTIIAFVREPSLRRRPSELLILSLSCADLGTGLIALPLYSPAFILPGHWPLGEIGCQIQVFFFDLTVHASLLTLLSISADRFCLVYLEYPKYLKVTSRRVIRALILASWIVAFLTGVLEMSLWNVAKTLDLTASLIDHSKHCLSPPRRMRAYSLTLFIVLYFTPILLMSTLSTAFLYFLYRRLVKTKRSPVQVSQPSSYSKDTDSCEMISTSSLNVPNLNPKGTTSTDKQRNGTSDAVVINSGHHGNSTFKNFAKIEERSRYIRPAVTLFALLLAMAVCMLPYCVYVMVNDIICQTCVYDVDVFVILLLLQFCNAFFDPFLYAMTQRKIRQYYKSCFKVFKSKCCMIYVSWEL